MTISSNIFENNLELIFRMIYIIVMFKPNLFYLVMVRVIMIVLLVLIIITIIIIIQYNINNNNFDINVGYQEINYYNFRYRF